MSEELDSLRRERDDLKHRNELWAADYARLMEQLQADAARLQRERDEARRNARVLADCAKALQYLEVHEHDAYRAALAYPDTRPKTWANYEPDSAESSDTVDPAR